MARASDPADTRIMGIVHGALRRDLLRVREVVSTPPYPSGAQRQAIGRHCLWLMEFLHAHHSGEDEGLWPAVRAANPAAGPLLDSLEADHRRVDPASTAVRKAGERYADSADDAARVELITALDGLCDVLFPHLDREIAEGMPVVSATLTDGEWNEIEQRYNVKPKSFAQLGFEGHWLIDGIDQEGYDVVVHTVPAVPRFILLHGFARPYRRRMNAVWGRDRIWAESAGR